MGDAVQAIKREEAFRDRWELKRATMEAKFATMPKLTLVQERQLLEAKPKVSSSECDRLRQLPRIAVTLGPVTHDIPKVVRGRKWAARLADWQTYNAQADLFAPELGPSHAAPAASRPATGASRSTSTPSLRSTAPTKASSRAASSRQLQ
eukprot:TRINITY_DN15582_c0_g1_i6.p1 TRINITY_DN15582_c0_g1~~TRINITY_DN15582_c0_g1_i6.p1  ORF type:complete len:150 (+),score=32.05 TRINITY_DN15582_c0_g1_i6:83-532(+)